MQALAGIYIQPAGTRPYQQFFHDTEVADSLRVVVDAMRLQSGKKDEKPEEVDINMMKSYPV